MAELKREPVLMECTGWDGYRLLDSGAADRIVRSSLAVVGEARAAIAFVFSGFLLGIPVFFDTVFYLMIPLGKALRMRTGANYALYVLTIVAGGTMAHSLVPPTPGPLFVAEELEVSLGIMIVAGCLVGLVTASVGYAWAVFANSRWEVPLRETPWHRRRYRNTSRQDEVVPLPESPVKGIDWPCIDRSKLKWPVRCRRHLRSGRHVDRETFAAP